MALVQWCCGAPYPLGVLEYIGVASLLANDVLVK